MFQMRVRGYFLNDARWAVSVLRRPEAVVLAAGHTYPFRQAFAALGLKYDPVRRGWVSGPVGEREAEDLVPCARGRAHVRNSRSCFTANQPEVCSCRVLSPTCRFLPVVIGRDNWSRRQVQALTAVFQADSAA